MHEAISFGLIVLGIAVTGMLAVLSSRLSDLLRVPAPAIFLVCAAVAAHLSDGLHRLPHQTVERTVSVALIVILFDGGLHIGRGRISAALVPVLSVGVLGTFLTAAAVAVLTHLVIGAGWWASALVGTAVAPTDPAMVFSVLGKREILGRSGTVLEGESGANDPVGIALMVALVAAGEISTSALASTAVTFLLQMAVGAVAGVLGGQALLWSMRRIALPSEGLYPLRVFAGAGIVFGLATVAHGSGFLAVFVAGLLIGDEGAPYKREIERFHAALASLGEIVAFVVLGLTVDLGVLSRLDVWLPGLALAALLALVVRPFLVGLLLVPVAMSRQEKAFVLWAGLKGAVPILLGTLLLGAGVPEAPRLYGIVVVIVVFSVVVQGGLVPPVAAVLHVAMRTVEPEPWALGLRLRDEPRGVRHYRVAPGSVADGATVENLPVSADNVWISVVSRDGALVPVRRSTALHAGDEVIVLADADPALDDLFTRDARDARPATE